MGGRVVVRYSVLADGSVSELRAVDRMPAQLLTERQGLAAVTQRLTEIGLADVQAARVHMALDDPHTAYEAIVRATDPRVTRLTADELKVALQYRFALELPLGRAVEALATYERLEALGLDAST